MVAEGSKTPERGDSEAEPASVAGNGFELKIRKPLEAAKAVGVLVAVALSVYNAMRKAEVPAVQAVETNQQATHQRIEGSRNEKGEIKDPGLAARLVAAEKSLRALEDWRCRDQQFDAQIFEGLGVHGIKVDPDCPALGKISITEERPMPGMRGQKLGLVVDATAPIPKVEE
jgi:hypothetical protein